MKITDHEIRRAEKLLLPVDCSFNEERRDFLRCMESRDVVACPGSGKTTALLAKLLILSSRMPFPDGRGVCVLTHTNVAIDQIKQKAGTASQILFRHPNFFGTIQEFANKFLALPAYVERFGQRSIRMDEDLYEAVSWKAFLDEGLQNNGFISNQLDKKSKKLPWRDRIPIKVAYFKDLRFDFDGDHIHYCRGDTGRRILRGDRNSPSYQDIHRAKYGLLEKGYMRYQDAFPLALWYLQNNPCLSFAFDERFAFVFIDEAQDTNEVQISMLDKAFSYRDRSIVQFLGDPNQAIFRFEVTKDVDWVPKDNPIHFSDTLRFGDSLTNLLETVRIDDQISLLPNKARKTLPPHLITFQVGEEGKVLTAFGRLLKEKVLDDYAEVDVPVFKAVGWVGKDKQAEGKLCIPSYFPDYINNTSRSRRYYSNLLSYLQTNAEEGIGNFRSSILRGACRSLNIAGIHHPKTERAFTANTFPIWLKDNNEPAYRELLLLLSEWVLDSANKDYDSLSARDVLIEFLHKYWESTKTCDRFDSFVKSDEIKTAEPTEIIDNEFHEYGVRITVDTVHSVKGETHTATLYLDTVYHNLSSHFLLSFLKGEYPTTKLSKPHHIEHLKVAHVAMSRPTHLLCFACMKSQVVAHKDDLEKNGWIICEVKDLVG
jgi:hypothetical protein